MPKLIPVDRLAFDLADQLRVDLDLEDLDTTTWVRGGAAARFSTSRNTALTLEGSVNRIYGESWLEGALRLSLYF